MSKTARVFFPTSLNAEGEMWKVERQLLGGGCRERKGEDPGFPERTAVRRATYSFFRHTENCKLIISLPRPLHALNPQSPRQVGPGENGVHHSRLPSQDPNKPSPSGAARSPGITLGNGRGKVTRAPRAGRASAKAAPTHAQRRRQRGQP